MSSQTTLLSIIIVSYNTARLTLQTIKSTLKDIESTEDLRTTSEIIVVDNNSSDNTLERITSLKKTTQTLITIIKNKKNLGFATANNQGIEVAKGRCILLLNSDTIVQRGSLKKLVDALHPTPAIENLGIIAARLENQDGSYQAQGGSLPTLFRLATQMFGIDDIPVIGTLLPSMQETGLNYSQPTKQDDLLSELYEIGWVAGTAMMIHRSVIDSIGDLDEGIFMYAEDIEYCVRAQDHHIACAIHSGASVTHLKNASGSQEAAILGEFRGLLYLWAKHRPLWEYRAARLILIIGACIRIVLFGTIMGDKTRANAYKKALSEIRST